MNKRKRMPHARGLILATASSPGSQTPSRRPDANLEVYFSAPVTEFVRFCNTLFFILTENMLLMMMQMVKIAREKFTEEISFRSKDKDVSLAKVYRKFTRIIAVYESHYCRLLKDSS